MPSKFKLYYFDSARARCEFIRYIFAYADVPYDEILFGMDEWKAKIKNQMEMGVCPVLELENGVQVSQSLAIGRYLATINGLVSQDALENAKGDEVVGAIEDIYRPYYRAYALALFSKDEAKTKEAWTDLEKNGLTPLFQRLEKMLGDKKWFCGQNIHWSDLYAAELVDRLESATGLNKKDFVAKYPKLLAHCKRVHEIPSIKKYVQDRPKSPL